MNINKISLLLMLENIVLFPLNAEFLLIEKIKQNPKKSYYLIYMTTSIVGALFAYAFGILFSGYALTCLKWLSKILLNNETAFSDSILTTDPSTILLLKSLIPGVPISVLNIACGVFGTEVNRFLAVTLCFRTIRYLILNFVKHLFNIGFIKDIAVTLILVSLSYVTLTIFHV